MFRKGGRICTQYFKFVRIEGVNANNINLKYGEIRKGGKKIINIRVSKRDRIGKRRRRKGKRGGRKRDDEGRVNNSR